MVATKRNNDITCERRGPDLEEVFARGESVGMIRRYRIGGFTGWQVNDGKHGWETLEGKAHEVKGTAILALCRRWLIAKRDEARQLTMPVPERTER